MILSMISMSLFSSGKSEISDGAFEDTTFRFEYIPLYAKKENNGEEPGMIRCC